jgi:hypothetical protein
MAWRRDREEFERDRLVDAITNPVVSDQVDD